MLKIRRKGIPFKFNIMPLFHLITGCKVKLTDGFKLHPRSAVDIQLHSYLYQPLGPFEIFKLAIFFQLTERMARNALKTLQIGDVSRPVRKRSKRPSRSRQRFNNIPALTPIRLPSTPPILGFTGNKADTPLSIVATAGSSPSSCLSTPSQLSMTPMSSSVSTATTPLALDLREEPVMEGVEIATDNISSPSIADSSSVKSCSKPGRSQLQF